VWRLWFYPRSFCRRRRFPLTCNRFRLNRRETHLLALGNDLLLTATLIRLRNLRTPLALWVYLRERFSLRQLNSHLI
jgi:hypothetical protein